MTYKLAFIQAYVNGIYSGLYRVCFITNVLTVHYEYRKIQFCIENMVD